LFGSQQLLACLFGGLRLFSRKARRRGLCGLGLGFILVAAVLFF
jgi:hypothetical protein